MNGTVLLLKNNDISKAKNLSEKLNIEIIYEPVDDRMMVCVDDDGVSLIKDGMTIRGDFSQMLKRLNTANLQHEMLIKASKIKDLGDNPVAIDATAGLGEDSILLAAAGFRVKMFERDAIIAELLLDAMERARAVPELAPVIARMELVQGDSIEAMEHCDFRPDIIYLDPMFPARTKSGLIKKKFQLLQQLESPCEEGERLVKAAQAAKPGKIIIKRPLKGEFLAGIKPNHSISGKAIRYDCLV